MDLWAEWFELKMDLAYLGNRDDKETFILCGVDCSFGGGKRGVHSCGGLHPLHESHSSAIDRGSFHQYSYGGKGFCRAEGYPLRNPRGDTDESAGADYAWRVGQKAGNKS